MQPKIARTPKTSSLVKCRAAENEEAWDVSYVSQPCLFANLQPSWCLAAVITSCWLKCIGTQCCGGVLGASLKQKCKRFPQALVVSKRSAEAPRERTRLREGANEVEHVIRLNEYLIHIPTEITPLTQADYPSLPRR